MAGQERTFRVAGGTVAGHALGDAGPLVVMLHGFGSDRASWFLNQSDVAAYARTLALDLPGHGASSTDLADASAPAIAETVAAVLDVATAETGGPAHVVGHSFGGAVAIALAAARPDLVASLALIAPAGLGGRVNFDFTAAFTEMESEGDAVTALLNLVDRPRLISRQMAARTLAGMRVPGRRAALRAIGRALPDLVAGQTPMLARVAALPIVRAVLWGDHDRVSAADPGRAGLLASEWHLIAGAGHLPHMERPAAVNAILARVVNGAA